jgi:hypothetical protein
LLLAKDGGRQVVDAPDLAGTIDDYVPVTFQFMNGRIHRPQVNPQELGNPTLTDPDRGPLIGMPRENGVDATGGDRQRHHGQALVLVLRIDIGIPNPYLGRSNQAVGVIASLRFDVTCCLTDRTCEENNQTGRTLSDFLVIESAAVCNVLSI